MECFNRFFSVTFAFEGVPALLALIIRALCIMQQHMVLHERVSQWAEPTQTTLGHRATAYIHIMALEHVVLIGQAAAELLLTQCAEVGDLSIRMVAFDVAFEVFFLEEHLVAKLTLEWRRQYINTVRCRYNVINFLQNHHNRHLIALLWRWAMRCLLWF